MIRKTALLVFLGILIFSGVYAPKATAKGASSSKMKTLTFGKKETMRVGFRNNRIQVAIKPLVGEGTYQMGKRVLKDWRNQFKKLTVYNKNQSLKVHKFVPIPFNRLNSKMQNLSLHGVFPNDTIGEHGWVHRVTYSGETLSFIAGVFAKNSVSTQMLAKENRLKKAGRLLGLRDEIVIPWHWLREDLQQFNYQVKAPLKLVQGRDGKPYASYRLKKGEAIYSSVIVRFTGRVIPTEVNRLSKKLLKLNGISNPKQISSQTSLKIPIEWLSDQFVVNDRPIEKQIAKAPKKKKASNWKKQKFHVILDPGHGGRDPGAVAGSSKNGDKIFEDELVYDIMLRMKASLEKLGYVVHQTLKDPNQKKPVARLSTKKDEDEVLLVTPTYPLNQHRIGINLRVFLASHIYYKLINEQKVPKENIMLISIHGDSLGPQDRGAMVYYPDHRFRSKEFRLGSRVYRKYEEYTRRIRYSATENYNSAQASHRFGEKMIKTFKQNGILTHSSQPLRSFFYRNGRETLPAILRYSKVPVSVLVEVANLNNVQDRKLALRANFRQKIANQMVKAIKSHFKEKFNLQLAMR